MSIISKALYVIMIKVGAKVEQKFNKHTKEPATVNEEVLLEILDKNSKCEIGMKYDFKKIKSKEEYKNIVPLTEYSFFDEYIQAMAKGEKNILIDNDVEYFSHTSGTTGKQKLIPTTRESRMAASKYMAFLINRFSYLAFKDKWNYGRGLMIADIVMTTYTEGNIPICSATSGGMKAMKRIMPYIYTSPIEVMEIKDREVSLYLHLLFALQDKKLLYISGIFISNVLDLFRVLEKDYESLIKDIRCGRVCKAINIDEVTRKKLNTILKPNASRADELEKQFKIGFEGIAKRIWPNLVYIAAVTGANFSIYDDKLAYYTDNLPVYSPVYASSEAAIGINPYANKIQYVIIPDTVFYEFIPVDKLNESNPETLSIDELKVNEAYEIVITNYAGLYRYRLGDVVKVKGFYNKTPSIEFLFRKNQVLNMVAEKTNEEHLTTAIKNTMDKLHLTLVDYTTNADNIVSPGRYIFYFEVKNYNDIDNVNRVEELLDDELKKANLAYDRARKNNKLGMVNVILVKANTFAIIKENLLSKGISKNQIKIPRVANNNTMLGMLNENKVI